MSGTTSTPKPTGTKSGGRKSTPRSGTKSGSTKLRTLENGVKMPEEYVSKVEKAGIDPHDLTSILALVKLGTGSNVAKSCPGLHRMRQSQDIGRVRKALGLPEEAVTIQVIGVLGSQGMIPPDLSKIDLSGYKKPEGKPKGGTGRVAGRAATL